MVKIGMILGGRYEVIEKIGTGGMSDVYKAKDSKLNRYVAVKVLKQEFGENESFVAKFRVEAQAAAGLMHSNIVNVYDVGEENEIHYIVMELVEGITLKKYIEKKARLTYKEAVSIAIQVSLGIDAAHRNHIIHRDIKPQNIIISKDGKVKVTDFGIAKAATSNTITSNVMGSVHYTSPEQARGGYSDEKSDIYSLGITMFEMLTGRVPFNGETTVAIAIKHIQEPMPSPRDYVAEIPRCVESIVLKCCEKSPDRRYQNMHDLIEDLKQSLIRPDEDFVTRIDPELEGGTRIVSEEEFEEIRNNTGFNDHSDAYQETYPEENDGSGEYYEEGQGDYEEEISDFDAYEDAYDENLEGTENGITMRMAVPVKKAKKKKKKAATFSRKKTIAELPEEDTEGSSGEEKPASEEEDDAFDAKMERITTVLAILAGIIILAIIFILVIKILDNNGSPNLPGSSSSSTGLTSPVIRDEDPAPGTETGTTEPSYSEEKVAMIDVNGLAVDEARNQILAIGLYPSVTYEESETVTSGTVISANVEAGTELEFGASVILTVSSGTSGIEIPDVAGKTYDEAYNVLTQKGFMVNRTESGSDSVEEGKVISQNPASTTKAPSGSVVTVTVSTGKEDTKIRVPNLLNQAESDAGKEVTDNSLVLGNVSYVYNADVEAGYVCGQSISYGTYVESGTAIDLQVSLGAGIKTYKYNANITAPTTNEAPFYTSGMEVSVKLVANDGTVLLDTKVTSFPQAANYYGLTSDGGTITMTYTYSSDGYTTIDADGKEVVVPGETKEASFDRTVEFISEG